MITKVGGSKDLYEYEAICDRCGFTFESEDEMRLGDFRAEMRDNG